MQAYPVHADIVRNVGQLEALMVPADYPKKLEANIPADFNDLPRLLGRSTVRIYPVELHATTKVHRVAPGA